MPRKNKKVPTDSAYLDNLGTIAARDAAPLIRQRAAEQGISLPMNDKQLDKVLTWTIDELVRMKKMSWRRSSTEARGAFVAAWVAEMDRQGIRA